jgi:hypothetical protein
VRQSVLVAVLAAACIDPVLAASPPAAPPRTGSYDAEFCVTLQRGAAPTCGAADVVVNGAHLSVRVSDIVYRLALQRAKLDVETMHGRMQIDEFSAPYEWIGDTLRFGDEAKQVLYEVRLGAKKPTRR